jgi:transcriptional regulator with XRE-family HTH domain
VTNWAVLDAPPIVPPLPERPAGTSRLAASLQSARHRAGWSREALAYHSGLTWSAIAQIESGRRQDVRLSSLRALADALGVTVDYLVGSKATVSAKLLEHTAVMYGAQADFVASVAPFVSEGITRGEALLVVSRSRQVEGLRNALGNDGRQVEFADSAEWYRSPGQALTRYRAFVDDQFARGASWVRVIGESPWEGRSSGEIGEWIRYESLFNLFFASSPVTVVCPYDTRTLPERILAGARHTHPTLGGGAGHGANSEYEEPEAFLLRTGS